MLLRHLFAACTLVLACSGCGAASSGPGTEAAPTTQSTVTATVTKTATVTETTEPTVITSAAPASTTQIVPYVLGDSLAAAHLSLENLSVSSSKTTAHDISGKTRTVILPENWKICTQKPQAGEVLTSSTIFQFGVVKFGERCP
jgi:hypothetical protein